MNNERKRKLFNSLVKDGYTFAGDTTWESFEKVMATPDRAKKLYDRASMDGYKFDRFETFMEDFGAEKQELPKEPELTEEQKSELKGQEVESAISQVNNNQQQALDKANGVTPVDPQAQQPNNLQPMTAAADTLQSQAGKIVSGGNAQPKTVEQPSDSLQSAAEKIVKQPSSEGENTTWDAWRKQGQKINNVTDTNGMLTNAYLKAEKEDRPQSVDNTLEVVSDFDKAVKNLKSDPFGINAKFNDRMNKANEGAYAKAAESVYEQHAIDSLDEYEKMVNAKSKEAKKDLAKINGNQFSKKYDEYKYWSGLNVMQNYSAANSLIKEAKTMINEANKEKKDSKEGYNAASQQVFAGGRGLADALFSADNWTFGLIDMATQTSLKRAVDKYDEGKELSESEQILLDAAATSAMVKAIASSGINMGYNVGETIGMMAPFMLEMAINPAAGIGKGLQGYAMRTVLPKFAAKFGTGKMSKAMLMTGKGMVRGLGDVAGYGIMTTTTGMPSVVAGAYERNIGDLYADMDENWMTKYSGKRGNNESLSEAYAKSFTDQMIERYTEGAGQYFAPIAGIVGNATGKLTKPVKDLVMKGVAQSKAISKAKAFVETLSQKEAMQMIKKGREIWNGQYMLSPDELAKFKEAAKWDGFLAEDLEEQLGNVLNAALVGDMTTEKYDENGNENENYIFNRKMQIETALACALPAAFFSTINGGVHVKDYLRHKKMLDNLDAQATARYGNAWNDIKKSIDLQDLDHGVGATMQIWSDPTTPDPLKGYAVEYMYDKLTSIGAMQAAITDQVENPDPNQDIVERTVGEDGMVHVMETNDGRVALSQGVTEGSEGVMLVDPETGEVTMENASNVQEIGTETPNEALEDLATDDEEEQTEQPMTVAENEVPVEDGGTRSEPEAVEEQPVGEVSAEGQSEQPSVRVIDGVKYTDTETGNGSVVRAKDDEGNIKVFTFDEWENGAVPVDVMPTTPEVENVPIADGENDSAPVAEVPVEGQPEKPVVSEEEIAKTDEEIISEISNANSLKEINEIFNKYFPLLGNKKPSKEVEDAFDAKENEIIEKWTNETISKNGWDKLPNGINLKLENDTDWNEFSFFDNNGSFLFDAVVDKDNGSIKWHITTPTELRTTGKYYPEVESVKNVNDAIEEYNKRNGTSIGTTIETNNGEVVEQPVEEVPIADAPVGSIENDDQSDIFRDPTLEENQNYIASSFNENIANKVDLVPMSSNFSMDDFTDKNGEHPVLEGVLHKDGLQIASDSKILVVKEGNYDKTLEGKIILVDPKKHKKLSSESVKGNIIEGKFLNYEKLTSESGWIDSDVNIDGIGSFLEGVIKKVPRKDIGNAKVLVDFGNGNIGCFDPVLLYKFVKALKNAGASTIRYKNTNTEEYVINKLSYENGRNKGLVMGRIFFDYTDGLLFPYSNELYGFGKSVEEGNNNGVSTFTNVEDQPTGQNDVPVDQPNAPEVPVNTTDVPVDKPTDKPTAPKKPGKDAPRSVVQAYADAVYGVGTSANKSYMRIWEITHKNDKTLLKGNKKSSSVGLKKVEQQTEIEPITEEEALELQNLGVQIGKIFVTDGKIKFKDFFNEMVLNFGDNIRQYVGSIYGGIAYDRSLPKDVRKQMDGIDEIDEFDINTPVSETGDIETTNTNNNEESSDSLQPDGREETADVVDGAGEPSGPNTDESVSTGTDNDAVGRTDVSGNDQVTGDGKNGTVEGGSEKSGRTGRKGNSGVSRRGGNRRRGNLRTYDGSGDVSSNSDGTGRTGRTDLGLTDSEDAEAKRYEEVKNEIAETTDTDALKIRKSKAVSMLSETTDKIEKAKLNGEIRAINDKLRELFSAKPKENADISQEKTPYSPSSDSNPDHAIGSVIPTGAVSYVNNALNNLVKDEGKSITDFVVDELGYKNADELYSDYANGKETGLASEQVDSVALAIHQMKKGKGFIIGDMTGVGKGRQGAALIRWGLKHGKRVVFVTEKADLFAAMYQDMVAIGSGDYMPLTANSGAKSNITDEDGKVVFRHPNDQALNALWQTDSTDLPRDKKGRPYDFVMMTYTQGTARNKSKVEWLKNYAKDAIVILDESHNASGDSAQGKFFADVVENAAGVTFMSATYAKRPDNMVLYSLRTSMGDTNMTREDLIKGIAEYGVPMQEMLAANLFKSGEMIRRERDFSDVKTHWLMPGDVYSQNDIEAYRKTSDKTFDIVNKIIDFQRQFMSPLIKAYNEPYKERNEEAYKTKKGIITEYVNTPYSSQVSNIMGLMVYAMKAEKAAELAISQIKEGKKPIIATENTMGSYVDAIDGSIEHADFSHILEKGVSFMLHYKKHQKKYNKAEDKWEEVEGSVEDFDAESELNQVALLGLKDIYKMIKEYTSDQDVKSLTLSPIDLIKNKLKEAGYSCGEITGRDNELVKNEDGTFGKKSLPSNKGKEYARRFNGGSAKNPLPEKEQFDAIILNVAGATGISLHASKSFGNRKPRTMIIVQPARNVSIEVQMRGRGDRTGQLSRCEYFYLVSPIPAEQKLIMMLKQKLASMDANTVGTEEVSSNKVDAVDMDNKYGDDIAVNFMRDHLNDLNFIIDHPLKQDLRSKQWVAPNDGEGYLYTLMKDIQRLDCDTQEFILNELSSRYIEYIDYLNQNGINDLKSTTMNLEASTIDEAIFIKGKDNESSNEFAHDTNIERVEVNQLKKPLKSENINAMMGKLGSLTEDGSLDTDLFNKEYAIVREYSSNALSAKKAKGEESMQKVYDKLAKENPREDAETDEEYEERLKKMPEYQLAKYKADAEYSSMNTELEAQILKASRAFTYLKPGRPYFVPLTDDVSNDSPMSYGRFVGFDMKDGSPRNIRAVFAVKDSRSKIEIPVVSQSKTIEHISNITRSDSDLNNIGGSQYEDISEEDRRDAWDKWWDAMIPKNNTRSIRYMITGNVVQACGSLGKYKGQIVTFTRKDKETGEVTTDRGMLLAENFDPENFQVRTKVTLDDIWNDKSYEEIRDDISKISAYRDGNRLTIFFWKKGEIPLSKHPIKKDEGFISLTTDGVDPYDRDRLYAQISEEKVEEALEYLYKNYGYTKSALLVLPDSTEKPDAIVYTGRPYEEVIDEYSKKYGVSGEYGAARKVKDKLKRYKMDINNELLKTEIRELVQLRQAYIRKRISKEEDSRLAWESIIQDEAIQKYANYKSLREDAYNEREAIKEEMDARGLSGTALHLKQGETDINTVKELFDGLNEDKTNEEMFDKMFDKMKKLHLAVALNEKLTNSTGGQAGGIVLEYNWKYMNAQYITDQMKANTIVHEMMHTMAYYATMCNRDGNEHLIGEEMNDVIEELKNIYSQIHNDKVFTHGDGYSQYTMYGTQDVDEMLSEAVSNELFREDLRKITLKVTNKDGIITFRKLSDGEVASKTVSAYDAIMSRANYLIENFNEHAWRENFKGTNLGEYKYNHKANNESVVDFARRLNEENKAKEERRKSEFHEELNSLIKKSYPKASSSERMSAKAAVEGLVKSLGINRVVFEAQEGAAEKADLMTTSDGQVYGWADGEGKIHLTPLGVNPNTPLHEYGHLYARAIEHSNPRLWARIKELLNTLPKEIWDFVDENYKDLEGDARYREVFSRYFGNRGSEKLKEDTKKVMGEGLDWKSKGFVADLFGRIKQAMEQAKKWIATNVLKLDPKKFKNIDDVFDKTYYDFANGYKPEDPNDGGPKGGKRKSEAMVEGKPSASNFMDYVRKVTDELNKVKDSGDIKKLGDGLSKFVEANIRSYMAGKMNSLRIKALSREISNATTKDELSRSILTLERIMNEAKVDANVTEMAKMINIKLRGVNHRGVAKGYKADPETQIIMQDIRSAFKSTMMTEVDGRLQEAKKVLGDLRKEAKDLAMVETYDQITKKLMNVVPGLQEKCEEVEAMKEEIKNIEAEKESIQSSNQQDEIAAVREKMQELEAKIGEGKQLTPEEERMYDIVLPIREKLAKLRNKLNAPYNDKTGDAGLQYFTDEYNKLVKDAVNKMPATDRENYPEAWKEYDQIMKEADVMQEMIVICQEDVMNMTGELGTILSNILHDGAESYKRIKEQERLRKQSLVAMACKSVKLKPVRGEGDPANEKTRWEKFIDYWDRPLRSLEYMIQISEQHSHLGEGPMYEYFITDPETGIVAAESKLRSGLRNYFGDMDDKLQEIFGVGFDRKKLKKMLDKVIEKPLVRQVSKNDIKNDISNFGETDRELGDDFEIKSKTIGNALYLWCAWRQNDGKVKMKANGYTDDTIRQIEDALGPKLIQLAEWVTDEFYPKLRKKYDKTYVDLMHTHLANIPHYFPLQLAKSSLAEKGEIGKFDDFSNASIVTSNIIERTANLTPLSDQVSFLEIFNNYGRNMEQWNAMAKLISDFNTLHASKAFRNFMDANRKGSFNDLMSAAEVATWSTYQREYDPIEGFLNKLITAKGTAAISYRLGTALKQFASYPMFLLNARDRQYYADLIKYATPTNWNNNYQWAMNNLSSFRNRIDNGDMGLEGLNDPTLFGEFMKKYREYGFLPNRVIDMLTIAAGARSVYEQSVRIYTKMGMNHQNAHDRAVNDATLAFNRTQQSSEPWASSPMQKSGKAMDRALTIFQNSPISYRRIIREAEIELSRIERLRKEEIARKVRMGLDKEQAEKEANARATEKRYRALSAIACVVLTGGVGWYMASNIGSLVGDDDDKYWDAFISAFNTMFLQGSTLGAMTTSYINGYSWSPFPFFDSSKETFSKMNDAGAFDSIEGFIEYCTTPTLLTAFEYVIKNGIGIDLETWSNILKGATSGFDGDWDYMDYLLFINDAKSDRAEWAKYLYEKHGPVDFAKKMQYAQSKLNKNNLLDYAKSFVDPLNGEVSEYRADKIVDEYIKSKDSDFFEEMEILKDLQKEYDNAKKKYDAEIESAQESWASGDHSEKVKSILQSEFVTDEGLDQDIKEYADVLGTSILDDYEEAKKIAKKKIKMYFNTESKPDDKRYDRHFDNECNKMIQEWKEIARKRRVKSEE